MLFFARLDRDNPLLTQTRSIYPPPGPGTARRFWRGYIWLKYNLPVIPGTIVLRLAGLVLYLLANMVGHPLAAFWEVGAGSFWLWRRWRFLKLPRSTWMVSTTLSVSCSSPWFCASQSDKGIPSLAGVGGRLRVESFAGPGQTRGCVDFASPAPDAPALFHLRSGRPGLSF